MPWLRAVFMCSLLHVFFGFPPTHRPLHLRLGPLRKPGGTARPYAPPYAVLACGSGEPLHGRQHKLGACRAKNAFDKYGGPPCLLQHQCPFPAYQCPLLLQCCLLSLMHRLPLLVLDAIGARPACCLGPPRVGLCCHPLLPLDVEFQ